MCDADFAPSWEVCTVSHPTAAVRHRCSECRRSIWPGEIYQLTKGKCDGRWDVFKTCRHCRAAVVWLEVVCGGSVYSSVFEELVEHWHDGYRSIAFGRIIVGMKNQWHDGADPVPADVSGLAQRMLQAAVA